MKNQIRVLLVGCGAISRTWLISALKEKEINIAGLVDINRSAAEKRQKSLNSPMLLSVQISKKHSERQNLMLSLTAQSLKHIMK